MLLFFTLPPYLGKCPKFSRFLIMTPPHRFFVQLLLLISLLTFPSLFLSTSFLLISMQVLQVFLPILLILYGICYDWILLLLNTFFLFFLSLHFFFFSIVSSYQNLLGLFPYILAFTLFISLLLCWLLIFYRVF